MIRGSGIIVGIPTVPPVEPTPVTPIVVVPPKEMPRLAPPQEIAANSDTQLAPIVPSGITSEELEGFMDSIRTPAIEGVRAMRDEIPLAQEEHEIASAAHTAAVAKHISYQADITVSDAEVEAAEIERWESIYALETARLRLEHLVSRAVANGAYDEIEYNLNRSIDGWTDAVGEWWDSTEQAQAGIADSFTRGIVIMEQTYAALCVALELPAPIQVFSVGVSVGSNLITVLQFYALIRAQVAVLEQAQEMARLFELEQGVIGLCREEATIARAHRAICDYECNEHKYPGICKLSQFRYCVWAPFVAKLPLGPFSDSARANALAGRGQIHEATIDILDTAGDMAADLGEAALSAAGSALSDSEIDEIAALGAGLSAAAEILAAGGSLEDAFGAAFATAVATYGIDFDALGDKIRPAIRKIDDADKRELFEGMLLDAIAAFEDAQALIQAGSIDGGVYMARAVEMLRDMWRDIQSYLASLSPEVLAAMGIDLGDVLAMADDILALAHQWIELARIWGPELVRTLAADYSEELPALMLSLMPREIALDSGPDEWLSSFISEQQYRFQYSDKMASALWLIADFTYGLRNA